MSSAIWGGSFSTTCQFTSGSLYSRVAGSGTNVLFGNWSGKYPSGSTPTGYTAHPNGEWDYAVMDVKSSTWGAIQQLYPDSRVRAPGITGRFPRPTMPGVAFPGGMRDEERIRARGAGAPKTTTVGDGPPSSLSGRAPLRPRVPGRCRSGLSRPSSPVGGAEPQFPIPGR